MRIKNVIINALSSLASQFILVLLSFSVRKLLLIFLGLEYVGLSGLFSNILSLLNLAELGVGIAITTNLYKPLAEGDYNRINALMRIYSRLYRKIGLFIVIAGILVMFAIPYLVNGATLTPLYIRAIFLLQTCSTASTYFIGYRRSLLYADQKNHVSTIYDTLVNIGFGIFQILQLFTLKSYLLFLVLQILQTVTSNVLIHLQCGKRYPYINDKIVEDQHNAQLVKDIKNIFSSKIAGYVYNSTDNLVISIFLGVSQVALLSNYTMISVTVQTFINKSLSPIVASIGNFFNDTRNKQDAIVLLFRYTFARYVIMAFVTSLILALTQPFIELWLGKQFMLPLLIVILISANLFLGAMQGPLGDYIIALGFFKYDKYLSICCATTNLLFSVFLVNKIGISGVLLGTAISEVMFWGGRSFIVYHYYFNEPLWRYWGKMTLYICTFMIQATATCVISNLLFTTPGILSLGGRLLVCVTIAAITNVMFFVKTREFKYFLVLLKKITGNVIRRKAHSNAVE